MLLLSASTTSAQTASATPVSPSRGFVGGGLLFGASDGESRIRFPDDTASRQLWQLEGSVPVGRIAALGVEFVPLETVTGGTRGNSFELRERQEERVLLGLLRLRPPAPRRVAIDFVTGAGVLFQNRETVFESCGFLNDQQICAEHQDFEGRRSLALGVGVDVPVALGRHVSVAPLARVLFLQRGDDESSTAFRSSSTRLLFGVTARAGW